MTASAEGDSGNLVDAFVGGVRVTPLGGHEVDLVDPSSGRPCGTLVSGGEADANRAVASARAAFDSGRWSEAPPSVRKKVLHRLADLVSAHSAELDRLDAVDMGKPVGELANNANGAAGLVRFCAEAVDKVAGEVCASGGNCLVIQRLVPRGVVAAVTPWNFPTYVAMLKAAPALAAGNCVVLKPSELSSRSAVRIAELAMQAGLPPGVLNVVPGLGETVGRALGLHVDVDVVTFTGSTSVGKLMLQYAGQSNLKLVKAECGGKSPQILFADGVDIDAACHSIARGVLINQGQVCSAGSRLLVQRSVEARVVDAIATLFKQIVMGRALDPQTTYGPLASARQCANVMQYIETAPRDGAELVTGGRRALRDSGGYFVDPTLFRNVPPSARIAQEEIFGPVLSVIPFDDEAEALRVANGTAYGLMAYVWTSDLSRGMRMAKGLRSPVMVNAAPASGEGAGAAFSFEPARQSGLGAEGGMAGMESYLRRQMVKFNHA